MFLIDTDVLSALGKRKREANVESWMAEQRSGNLFVSVISIELSCVGKGRTIASRPLYSNVPRT